MSKLIIIRGPVGACKSTIAKTLMKQAKTEALIAGDLTLLKRPNQSIPQPKKDEVRYPAPGPIKGFNEVGAVINGNFFNFRPYIWFR